MGPSVNLTGPDMVACGTRAPWISDLVLKWLYGTCRLVVCEGLDLLVQCFPEALLGMLRCDTRRTLQTVSQTS